MTSTRRECIDRLTGFPRPTRTPRTPLSVLGRLVSAPLITHTTVLGFSDAPRRSMAFHLPSRTLDPWPLLRRKPLPPRQPLLHLPLMPRLIRRTFRLVQHRLNTRLLIYLELNLQPHLRMYIPLVHPFRTPETHLWEPNTTAPTTGIRTPSRGCRTSALRILKPLYLLFVSSYLLVWSLPRLLMCKGLPRPARLIRTPTNPSYNLQFLELKPLTPRHSLRSDLFPANTRTTHHNPRMGWSRALALI